MQLMGLAEAAKLLGVSVFTVRRLADLGDIRVVNVGARRLVALSEVERVALHGAGKPRPRRSARSAKTSGKRAGK
jgi:excisionase family DNA binding protein